MKPRLSLSLIVRNEEPHIARVLEHARIYADEIVVVDTGSTDRTREIAASIADRVADFTWVDDFAAARNFALDQCTGEFVMYLDADDVVDEPSARGIRALVASEPDWDVCSLTYVYSRDREGAPRSVKKVARVWRNDVGIRWKFPIHEALDIDVRRHRMTVGSDAIRVLHDPVQRAPNHAGRNLRILLKAVADPAYAGMSHFWWHLAKEYRAMDEPAKAVESFEAALACKDPIARRLRSRQYLGLASQRRKLGHLPQALEAAGRALTAWPHWREPACEMAEIYWAMKRNDDALAVLRMASAVPQPRATVEAAYLYDGPRWYALYAQGLERTGDVTGALECVRGALARFPDSSHLLRAERRYVAAARAADDRAGGA